MSILKLERAAEAFFVVVFFLAVAGFIAAITLSLIVKFLVWVF